jgi:acylphosphatase
MNYTIFCYNKNMQKRVELKVHGEVQGVFFRDSTRNKARELNLSGYVRNKLNGTVEIIAEGPEEILQKLIVWCQEHPGYSKVKKVEIKWGELKGGFEGFIIR